MNPETLLFEQATPLPGHGAPILVTILRPESRGRYLRESHVFLPDSELHLHEIGRGRASGEEASSTVCALRETHALLAARLAEERKNLRGPAALAYQSRFLAEHPFFRFRLEGRFRNALWEMQDWTTSPALRALLAQVTGYRSDLREAELLARIFAGAASAAPASG
jgi:hypothetical protein